MCVHSQYTRVRVSGEIKTLLTPISVIPKTNVATPRKSGRAWFGAKRQGRQIPVEIIEVPPLPYPLETERELRMWFKIFL